ncbi:cation transporter [Nitriliruptoraceae bacterium ZYF776]|nr:cation transporter [Profundirhabdus halotolerans]
MLASIAAAIVTIGLKAWAAAVTGSVGFLSDALESSVNLVAAVAGLVALVVAARPPDDTHDFGHGKAEYLSAALEGVLILGAAGLIGWTAVQRLLDPVAVEQPGVGLALSGVAALVNLAVGVALVRAGRRHRSITLTADGHHLLTDVWTSAGVFVGIALVALFGWQVLDPLVALAVGANILRTGARLVHRATVGLLDGRLPAPEVAAVEEALRAYRATPGVHLGAVRTRESGRQRFVYVPIEVPASWTVAAADEVADRIRRDVDAVLPGCTVFVLLGARDGPSSAGRVRIDAVRDGAQRLGDPAQDR